MEPAAKKQLNRDYRRFLGLERAERERLRRLHSQLDGAPELRRVLSAYCGWLKSLPPEVRAELLDLEPSKRIERIKELRAEEAKRPKPKDVEGLQRWMQDYAAQPEHQELIFQEMITQVEARVTEKGNEMMRKGIDELKKKVEGLKKSKDPRARMTFAYGAMWWQMSGPERPDWLIDGDLEDLRKNLSDGTSKLLASKPVDEQWEVVRGWLRPSRGRPFPGGRFGGVPQTKESQEQLDEFFEKELTAEQKEELLHLPPEEMQRRLEWMYTRRSWPTLGPFFDGRGPGPGGPPRDHSGRPRRGPREEGPPMGDGPGQRGEGPRQDRRPRER